MPRVYLSDYFLKQFKPHAKKFRKLQADLTAVLNNFLPELAQPLGRKLYKVRLKASDIPRGKSKSFRVIIFLWQSGEVVVPVTIYFKGDQQNIPEKEIEYHYSRVLQELESKQLIVD